MEDSFISKMTRYDQEGTKQFHVLQEVNETPISSSEETPIFH